MVLFAQQLLYLSQSQRNRILPWHRRTMLLICAQSPLGLFCFCAQVNWLTRPRQILIANASALAIFLLKVLRSELEDILVRQQQAKKHRVIRLG